MKLTKSLLATVPLLQATATAGAPGAPCDAVHFFMARGTDEPLPGRQGALTAAACRGLPEGGCGAKDVAYPATGFGNEPDYCDSAALGVAHGIAQVTAYAARCPGAKIVLTGYSQGAHVVGDIIGGGGGDFKMCKTPQPSNKGLSPASSPGNQIAAVTFFGDLRHVANQSYTAGDGAAGAGLWPRSGSQLASLNTWSDKLRSWCLSGDPICAGGGDINDHLRYLDEMFLEEAADFIKTML